MAFGADMTPQDVVRDVYDGVQKFRKRLQSRVPEWRENLLQYEGAYAPDDEGQRSVLTNLVYGLINRIVPSIYFKNPYIAVSGRGETPHEVARLWEEIINYLVHVVSLDMEARKAIFDCLFRSVGFLKVGVQESAGANTRSAISQTRLLAALNIAAQYAGVNPFEPAARASREDLEFQVRADWNQSVRPHTPYIVRVQPEMLVPDPWATSPQNARWLAQLMLKPREELVYIPGVDQAMVDGIDATYADSLHEDVHTWFMDEPANGEDVANLVAVWEVWHKPTRKVYTFADVLAERNEYSPLSVRDWPYDFLEFPYHMLKFSGSPDSWFGIADVATWTSLVTGYQYLQTKQLQHVRRFNRMYVISKDDAQPGVIDAIESEKDGRVVVVQSPSPDGRVVPVIDAPITGDAYALQQRLHADLTFVSGVTFQRQGVQQRGDTTATEASILEGQAQLRDNDRLFLVTKWIEATCTQLLKIARQDMSLEDTLFVSNSPRLAAMWQQVQPLLNAAEVDVRVRVGATAHKTQDVRLKQLLDFMNLTSNLIDPMTGLPLMNQREFAARIAEELHIEDYERLFMPVASPMGYTPGGGGPGGGGGARPGSGPLVSRGEPGSVGNPGIQQSRVQNVAGRPMAPPNPKNE